MFADSILETSWAQRSRRSWTTLSSFALETLAIGVLLLLPLWRTVGLPKARVVSTPISAGRPEPGPVTQTPHAAPRGAVQIIPVTSALQLPHRMPTSIARGDDGATVQPSGCDGCVGIPGIGSGGGGGLPIPGLLSGTHPVMPALPTPTISRVIRTSSMLEGSLIRKVQPAYPPLAKSARIQGAVILFAVISKTGTIENLRLVSGHPMLASAAIDAVSQWRYRPYILNNEPVEVETQITVNFILGN
jgi:periplasmic protein TonB